MNGVNFNRNNQPSFGMAFKFGECGAKRMAETFRNVPDTARKLIKDQLKNTDVDAVVTDSRIEIVPKLFKEELDTFIKTEMENRLLTNMQKGLNGIDVYPPVKNYYDPDYFTPVEILADRDSFHEAASLSNKIQAQINKLKDRNMSVEDFAEELKRLSKTE